MIGRLRGQAATVLTPRDKTWLGLLSGGFLLVLLDVALQGPLTQLDLWVVKFDGQERYPGLDPLALVYDKVGQRTVTVPLLLLVAGYLVRRHHTWRPVALAGFAVVSLNVVVGAMKIIIGRSETETGSVDIFSGGMIFPSGHSANMVLTGGLIIYLLKRYTENPPVRGLVVVVAVATLLTCATSIYIGSHWVSDLIGGALVGGMLLQALIVFDRGSEGIRPTGKRDEDEWEGVSPPSEPAQAGSTRS